MLYILDPNLKSIGGHYYEYDKAVAEAAAECVILCHRDADLPPGLNTMSAYSGDIWGHPRAWWLPGRCDPLLHRSFYRETMQAIGLQTLSSDIIFVPTVIGGQLLACAKLAEKLPAARFVVTLRYQPGFYTHVIARRAFRRMERSRKVTLSTDTHRLAREFGKLTSLPVEVFPIPPMNA